VAQCGLNVCQKGKRIRFTTYGRVGDGGVAKAHVN